ncbi:MAG: SusC/RagA family TonB-linked outer membrane protein [Ekhidna sp.]|nr:SusC/RagA family TonB-linked outer membrane protein [Ekhidna sp.]
MRKILSLFIVIMIVSLSYLVAQQRTISGTVTDDQGSPLPGVTVVVEGTTQGGTTDVGGNYRMYVDSETVLVFSYIGFETRRIPVGTRTVIDITLTTDTQNLEEVVVTAFGIAQEKRALAHAVQVVEGTELVQAKEANLVQALSGKVAGVQVTQQGGSAGAGSSILIRGISSVSRNSQPLFVVDGIPINNSFRSSTGTATGVDAANRAIDLNSADIESMTVLKGPAATALYGIQGTNGVVVIKTKSGGRSDTKVMDINFSSSYSVNTILNYFPKQNIYAQGDDNIHSGGTTFSHFGPPVSTLRFDGSANNSKNANGFIVDMNDPSATSTKLSAYDNQKDFYETGSTFENHVSMTSSSQNGSFYFSAGHLDQKGIIPNNEFERFTTKFTGENNVSENLRVKASATYSNAKSVKFGRGDNFSDVIQGTLRVPITFQNSAGFVLPNGEQRNWRYVEGSPFSFGPDNPFWTINENPYTDEVNRLIGLVQLDYKINDWLSVMYRLGTDIATDKRNQIWAAGSKGGDSRATSGVTGRLIEDTYIDQTLNSDLFITANQQFGEDFDFNAMIGQNYFNQQSSRQYFSGRNFGNPRLYNISNTTEDLAALDSETEKRTVAVLSRFNLGWRGTLFAELNLRNEWSSTLPSDDNSFLYGSANLGFVFTEVFNVNPDILSFGKIRGSVARVGNDAPLYALQTFYVNGSASTDFGGGVIFPINGVGGSQLQNSAGNPKLRPEQTDAIELGAELSFLKGKIGVDFTWYKQNSIDQIIAVALPGSTGAASRLINSGDIENKGVEIQLTGTPIQTSDLRWDILLNFTRNRNVVKDLPVNRIVSELYSARLNAVLEKDRAYNVFYGNAFERHENGQILIGDDGFPSLDSEQQFIGDPNPDWLMGIRNSVDYEGFTLSFLWDIRIGGDVANVTGHWMDAQGVAEHSEARGHSVIFNGVTADGSPNTQQVVLNQDYYSSSAGNRNIAERWIEDGSWIRLRDVSLSYSLPNKLTSKVGLDNLSLSVFGRNIWLITNYTGMDPETNLGSPSSPAGVDGFVTPNMKSYGVTVTGRF